MGQILIEVVFASADRKDAVIQFLERMQLRFTLLKDLEQLMSHRVFNSGKCLMFVEWSILRLELEAAEVLESLPESSLVVFGSSAEFEETVPDFIQCRIEYPFTHAAVAEFKSKLV